MTAKQLDKKQDHKVKATMLAIYLTRKHIEANNLPKFMAIDYSQKLERELLALKYSDINSLYRENGKPSTMLLWDGWEYEPLRDCLCFEGSKCDSIGECGK